MQLSKSGAFSATIISLICLAFTPSGVFAQDGKSSYGLPPCRTSAFMGQPGDGIRSDMGHHISGQPLKQKQARSTQIGLPACRTSVFMGQPGDGIRSDLGQHISGQQGSGQKLMLMKHSPQIGLPACRTSAYMGQPGDGIRSDLGRRISGQEIIQIRNTPQQQRSNYLTPALGYRDYH